MNSTFCRGMAKARSRALPSELEEPSTFRREETIAYRDVDFTLGIANISVILRRYHRGSSQNQTKQIVARTGNQHAPQEHGTIAGRATSVRVESEKQDRIQGGNMAPRVGPHRKGTQTQLETKYYNVVSNYHSIPQHYLTA